MKNNVALAISAIAISLIALVVTISIAVRPNKPVEKRVEVVRELGAVAGPVLDSPHWTVNGLRREYRTSGLNTGSTTVCSLRSPRNSTSTLTHAAVQTSTGTTTALTFGWGKSSLFDATTTAIGTDYRHVSGQLHIVSSSSPGTTGEQVIFAPGQYLNLKYAQGVNGTNSLVGNCGAEFTVIDGNK